MYPSKFLLGCKRLPRRESNSFSKMEDKIVNSDFLPDIWITLREIPQVYWQTDPEFDALDSSGQ
ncbi:MAG: hypothetical protein MUO57_20240 [Anaerolineales bacterium]|nr:hypothetical protein [Anaerolineales bacterium]